MEFNWAFKGLTL